MRPPGLLFYLWLLLISSLFGAVALAQGITTDAAPAAASGGIDLSSVLNELLQAIGAILLALVTTLGGIILNKLRAKYGIDVSNAQQAQFTEAASKAVTWAIGESAADIKANGWDHVPTQNLIAQQAGAYAVQQFPAILKTAGFDISSPAAEAAAAQRLADTVMKRVMPDAMAAAAASPATPPAPPPAAAPGAPLSPVAPAAPAAPAGATAAP